MGWLETRADVEEGAIVLIDRPRRVGATAIVLDIFPVVEVSLLVKLLVRAHTSTARESTVTCTTLMAAARLHTATNRAPTLGVILHQRLSCTCNLTNRGENRVLRRSAALREGDEVGVVTLRRHGRHSVLVGH